MYIRTSRKSAKTYRVAVTRDGDPWGKRKEVAAEKPEGRKGHGLGAGGMFDRGGGVESHACTERNWSYGNAVLMTDRNHPTKNVRVVGTRIAYDLNRRVRNEWRPNGGRCEGELKAKRCIVRASSMVNPKLCEENEEGLGPRVSGWERHELRKG